MTTLLIPEMNFTCNASVVGFIVSGRELDDNPHSRVQIWHKSSSQSSGSYFQVGSVPIYVHDDACVAMQEIVGDTYLCILHNNFRVSVQPGSMEISWDWNYLLQIVMKFYSQIKAQQITSSGIRISWTLILTFPLLIMEVQQLLNNYHKLSLTLHQVNHVLIMYSYLLENSHIQFIA